MAYFLVNPIDDGFASLARALDVFLDCWYSPCHQDWRYETNGNTLKCLSSANKEVIVKMTWIATDHALYIETFGDKENADTYTAYFIRKPD